MASVEVKLWNSLPQDVVMADILYKRGLDSFLENLQFISADLQQQKNNLAHRTNDYETKKPIFRRGQPAEIGINFDRPMQAGDSITIIMETGSNPTVSRNTKAVMPVSSARGAAPWSAVAGTPINNSMPVTIYTPANAVFGPYGVTLEITSEGRTTTHDMGNIAMLCNPWSPDDLVYLEGEAERKEYVLNQNTLYWAGTYDSNREYAWNLAQFKEGILDICFTLVDKCSQYSSNADEDALIRSDPREFVRHLSAVININDNDGGVLHGNWTGDYSGGKSPSYWKGSDEILNVYMKEGTVKYAQCWVFAAVCCSVCRCLGIPARMICNFLSAHDANNDITIDAYYTEKGIRISSMTRDSVWNFHVWNEVWMVYVYKGVQKRGWMVIDATPQERSGGIFRLGPCIREAVKNGDVDIDYDCPFVFGEVNANREFWTVYDDGSISKLYTETDSIGKLTCTKAIGANKRENITGDYKHPEESTEAIEVYNKAYKKLKDMNGPSVRDSLPEKPSVEPEFSCTFKKVEANIGIHIPTHPLEREKSIPCNISYSQYKNNLTPDNMILFGAVSEDNKGAKLKTDHVVTLMTPPLEIKLNDAAKLNQKTNVEITIINPLPEDIHDCVLRVNGSGLMKEDYSVNLPLVRKNDKATVTIEISPDKAGDMTLMASCFSDVLDSLNGFKSVSVAPS
ncbi:protein-glutamine gamma-glutamyltransferase E-like [Leptodactylus fuscus]|uniref:protein-glutamine gamma-glutamyltransferase E-like n=1 Tax=Leptodactylus fuscus TaxID=238119 RepID=UPI003F4F228C